MPLPKCPHCDAEVTRFALCTHSFTRPYVCLDCARASRVIRPLGQALLIACLAIAVTIYFVPWFSKEYRLLLFIGAFALNWLLEYALLAHKLQLTKVLPRVRVPDV
jgi:hypothetical protein